MPNQFASRLFQPAIIAPAQTVSVQRKGKSSSFYLLNNKSTMTVLKIAHLLKAKNIGIFMCMTPYEPKSMVTRFAAAADSESFVFFGISFTEGTKIFRRLSG
jgi:hypothetical protein